MPRFLTDERLPSASLSVVRAAFYREEFLKHQECLQQQREYFSEVTISQVEAALSRIMSQLETLCTDGDADQVVSNLLHKFDTVTKLSAWTDPKKAH